MSLCVVCHGPLHAANRSGYCQHCYRRLSCRTCKRVVRSRNEMTGTARMCRECHYQYRIAMQCLRGFGIRRPPPDELEANLRRYEARAALGLDLFDWREVG